MDKLGDVYLDLNQNDTNIDDLNLNAVWVEIDRGLSTENIGQQCETIVKLTESFDRFPLPVFVNSGFLRLAKVFQNGNNFVKLQIIRVIEKNQKHLSKVINIEEITKLIFYNIHSNDCICRALTLRALGEIASIISDKHNVQHSIRLALESHDDMEAKEAIYAANKFCSVSKSFAASLFERISELIEDIQSPLDRKMKLIPLLVHMHHDNNLSAKAKDLCQSMFYSFPRADISKIILNTLTQIACKSLTNIHETITFFLKLLHEEPREKINLLLLKNLHLLANKVAHLWTSENLNSFIQYAYNQRENYLLSLRASEILCTIAQNSNIYFIFIFDTSNELNIEMDNNDDITNKETKPKSLINSSLFQELIESMIFHEKPNISFNYCLLSTKLLTLQAKNIQKNKKNINTDYLNNLFELTKSGLFSIIMDCDKAIEQIKTKVDTKSQLKSHIKYLKGSLKCTIDLVLINIKDYFKQLQTFICNLLKSIGEHRGILYCETLLTLCRFQSQDTSADLNSYYENLQKIISDIFNKIIKQDKNEIKDYSELQLKLINLLMELQVRKTNYINQDKEPDKTHCIEICIQAYLETNENSLWNIFKLGRMCVRYSHYKLADRIYKRLNSNLPSNVINMSTSDLSYKSWFEFMELICKAECSLQTQYSDINEFIRSLNQAFTNYVRAQTLFKSLCTRCLSSTSSTVPTLETANTNFQIRYCELRSEQIKLYLHIILSSMTYQTIPAPVFQFKSSEVNFSKFGRIASQMKYSINELQKLNQKYKDFISECFDADAHTLNILNICKKQNECLIYCINFLSSPKSEKSMGDEFKLNFLSKNSFKDERIKEMENENENEYKEYSAEIKMSENFYNELFEKLKTLCIDDKTSESSSKINHVKIFQQILNNFIRFPIPLPRAFFTTLQKTQIKLIVNPNTKKTNTIHTLKGDQTLVIRIDGIIGQEFKKKAPIRTVKKVQICLTTELDPKSMLNDFKYMLPKYIDVKTSTEEPNNDYFNSNLLINFPFCGNYVIQVDLYILDDMDIVWRYIGERQQILIKVEEDANRQKLLAAIAAANNATTSSQVNLGQQQPAYSASQIAFQQNHRNIPITNDVLDVELQKMET